MVGVGVPEEGSGRESGDGRRPGPTTGKQSHIRTTKNARQKSKMIMSRQLVLVILKPKGRHAKRGNLYRKLREETA